MKLQQATAADIPLIQDLARRSWESTYVGIISNEQINYMLEEMYSKDEISKHLDNPNYHYYLIFDENNNSFEGFIGYEHGYEIETTKLHRIYLVPESKGKGFGKGALDFLKSKLSESSDKRIILNVNKENNARKFYESQNFKVYNEMILDIGNGFVMDDYQMEYIIHPDLT
ncbi:GNAT family N-acetyltransferase [Chryseobacterium sp. S0630]|uniref:GNAT family N-acetyltransferase n=1 Tax=unclassified Chryseobacterium TaxID=2593645 RepID=UPI0009DDAB82|nr:GNAT family N-acetyltransferase [Chryseobacterium sp. S0630]MCP1299563.1 GNAT family N-acetyltransferase [Chryseobacterium sp. S0630]